METRDGIGYIQFTQRWFEEGTAALPAFLQTAGSLHDANDLIYMRKFWDFSITTPPI